MITLLAVALIVVLLAGTCGFVIGIRQLPRMLSRMSPVEITELADKVERLKDGTG